MTLLDFRKALHMMHKAYYLQERPLWTLLVETSVQWGRMTYGFPFRLIIYLLKDLTGKFPTGYMR
jgi:hypothetical protein